MSSVPIIRRLIKVCMTVFALVIFGTAGYILFEGWTFLDGFFMTVITMSTVGYGITGDHLTVKGQWFTAGLICLSIVCMTCWTATLTSFIVEGDLGGAHLKRRMLKMITKLKDHTVVCGSGQMAQAVIERLTRQKVPVVVA